MHARTTANARACQKQLRTIEAAKEQYVMSRNLPAGTSITMSDLVSDGLLQPGVGCPEGYTYVVGAANVDPTCTSGLPDHVIQSP